MRRDRDAWKEGKGPRPRRSHPRRNRTSGKAVRHEYPSELDCTVCGTRTTIFRPEGQERPPGHQKRIHCFTCGVIRLHIELGAA